MQERRGEQRWLFVFAVAKATDEAREPTISKILNEAVLLVMSE